MDTNQLAIVTKRSIEGASTRIIADEIGVHQSTVVRSQQKPDIKAKVEAGINQLINRGLKPAVNTLCRAAAMGNTKGISSTPDLYKLSLDASKTILNHVSGSGPQTVINQLIYSQGTHAQTDQMSIQLVNRALGLDPGAGIDEGVIDVDR